MKTSATLAIIIALLICSAALSQVRNAPAGNNLPAADAALPAEAPDDQAPMALPTGNGETQYHCENCEAEALAKAEAKAKQQASSAAAIDTHGGREPEHDEHDGHDHSGHDHASHAGQPHVNPVDLALTGGSTEPVTLTSEERQAFEEAVDLDAFRKLAVFDNGRAKILDTLAREQLVGIFGKGRWQDTTGHKYDPVFSYLDLIFVPESYWFEPLIYVEVLELRRSMVAHMPSDEKELWLKRGRLAPAHFMNQQVQAVLQGAASDLQKRKGHDQVIRSLIRFDARLAMQPQEMGIKETLVLVSPPAGGDHWAHVAALSHTGVAAAGDQMAAAAPVVADPALGRDVLRQFQQLGVAWRSQDAASVNKILDQLTTDLPRLNPSTYPAEGYRQAEYIYNATHKFTIGYVAYFFAAIALMIAFRVPRPGLIATGIALLLIGFVIHSAGIGVRGALAGRWPIHNQFESFIAVSWFAALVGILLMTFRKQWIFGAAAAAVGFLALLVANTTPIPSHEVGQVAGILGTSRILYVHVNMVLASYALIALGFFTSMFYLALHYLPGKTTEQVAATSLGAVPIEVPANDVPADGEVGASSEINPSPTAPPGRQRLLNDLDHAQMVVLQLAFWVLGVGTLLGAYWADHAWGRFWAWDPKETWALITWIIYLMVIHVRFGVKRRGLVTAWLSVLGFISMLWCYWGVNLLLAGLHSYA